MHCPSRSHRDLWVIIVESWVGRCTNRKKKKQQQQKEKKMADPSRGDKIICVPQFSRSHLLLASSSGGLESKSRENCFIWSPRKKLYFSQQTFLSSCWHSINRRLLRQSHAGRPRPLDKKTLQHSELFPTVQWEFGRTLAVLQIKHNNY